MYPAEQPRNVSLLLRKHRAFLLPLAALLLFVVIYIPSFLQDAPSDGKANSHNLPPEFELVTRRVLDTGRLPSGERFRIGVVADLDKRSLVMLSGKKTWISFLRLGYLTRTPEGSYSITWQEERMLTTTLNEAGRGMELSELVLWQGMLLAVDDRTGVVFEIIGYGSEDSETFAVPRFILPDGEGNVTGKGMKSEWATLYDDSLLIGSIGKEWTTVDGKPENTRPQWVKLIEPSGNIKFLDWKPKYEFLRRQTGTSYPGYLLHEAVAFDHSSRNWLFAPRRFSKGPYDERLDNEMGTNLLLIVEEDFSNLKQRPVGSYEPLRGASSIKFVPGYPDEVVILKTEEDFDTEAQKTYIGVFNWRTSKVLMAETFVSECKFEGVEFLSSSS